MVCFLNTYIFSNFGEKLTGILEGYVCNIVIVFGTSIARFSNKRFCGSWQGVTCFGGGRILSKYWLFSNGGQ